MQIRSLLSVSAAVLVGALSLSPAAHAAEGDTDRLIALTAQNPTENGTSYEVKPGGTVAVEAGVANLDDKPVTGLVVHLWFIGSEQRLTDNFSNCQYYLDGTRQGAWCEFDQELAAGGKYSLPPLHVSVPDDAKETRTLVEVVFPKEYADSRGGIAALAKSDGDKPGAAGTGAAARLVEGTNLTPSKHTASVSFIYFHLNLPTAPTGPSAHATPSTPASVSATPTSAAPTSATPTSAGATAAAGQGGGTNTGGLAVTGSNVAVVAGVGAVLLVGGVAAFLLTRRRRDRFTA
ncbi:LPXTG cell wall anchor domain-containing protein [Krasilnikovia sp. MM14-A1004]|uniref:LPXTG cell wall anchor domain-containing protein n=1 Tax=Krasilnikovia sp. MM14-A1004 TaxID=3373541 RepID=UPI00399C7C22